MLVLQSHKCKQHTSSFWGDYQIHVPKFIKNTLINYDEFCFWGHEEKVGLGGSFQVDVVGCCVSL